MSWLTGVTPPVWSWLWLLSNVTSSLTPAARCCSLICGWAAWGLEKARAWRLTSKNSKTIIFTRRMLLAEILEKWLSHSGYSGNHLPSSDSAVGLPPWRRCLLSGTCTQRRGKGQRWWHKIQQGPCSYFFFFIRHMPNLRVNDCKLVVCCDAAGCQHWCNFPKRRRRRG